MLEQFNVYVWLGVIIGAMGLYALLRFLTLIKLMSNPKLDDKIEVTFEVRRNMKKCIKCKHNPKNMKLFERIAYWWWRHTSFPTICGMCTGAELLKRMRAKLK